MVDEAAALGAPLPDGSVAETHVSVVVLLGDRAYKFPKPVTFPFLDQSTPQRRAEVCAQEVALNRRMAPDVYLGTGRVVLGDSALDPCVVMRRMPLDRRLARLIQGEGGHDEVHQVARRVAAFHATAERADRITVAAAPAAVRKLWDDNLREITQAGEPWWQPTTIDEITALARRYLDGREDLLLARQADGHICDGHGDLLADDIFCLDDGPRILDCLAFDERLRHGDVLLDTAFLAMDLEHRGRRDLADLFLTAYEEFSAEHHPSSLAHHYVAYRALVRAKVTALRIGEQAEAADEARSYLDQCLRHLRQARVRLILIGGPPGAGKTTLARELGGRLGMPVLRSDEVRKELIGRGATERGGEAFGEGIYGPDSTQATYDELLHRAEVLLRHGQSVIVDASWSTAVHRAAAAAVADETTADRHELHCSVDPAIALDRVRVRLAADEDASDADEEVARRLAADFEHWPAAVPVDTDRPVEQVVTAARAVVEAPL